MNVDDRSLANNLRTIISQRLVRRVCEECRDLRTPSDEECRLFEDHDVARPESLANAVGCDRCHRTGYHERMGVFEIVVVTPEIAEAIEHGKGERELRSLLREASVTSLTKDGLQKVSEGLTTLEEVRSMYGFAK